MVTTTRAPRWQVFLAELKRRNVFRVAAIYGATGFIVLQAADLLFPRLGLPDWTVTLVVAIGLIGFPFAIALAWAFEAGPGGLQRTEPASVGEIHAIVAQPRSRRWPAGIAALGGAALLIAGGLLTLGLVGDDDEPYDSIAVLPFVDLSGAPGNEYFGDGLAEELLNALAGIDGLKVAARTSAFALKNTSLDVRAIGDTLGVATVLEGSVRRSADRVRITAQLIDAQTGYHIWSESYDRPMTELFTVQSDLAGEIVEALAIRLSVADSALHRGGTSDVEAYDLYLLGRQNWASRQMPALREAIGHFEAALARDSSFALAWSGLADAINALAWRAPEELHQVPHAYYAAQRAVVLDPELAEAWASLGVLWLDFDRDWAPAELALRRALALKPSYAPPYRWLSDLLRNTGRVAEAVTVAERGTQLDPLSTIQMMGLAHALVASRRWDEAQARYEEALAGEDAFRASAAVSMLANARAFGLERAELERCARIWAESRGHPRPAEAEIIGAAVLDPALRNSALALLPELEALAPPAIDMARIALALGARAAALDYLDQAFRSDEASLAMIGTEPSWDPIRDDPRFLRITAVLGIPNELEPAR
jgi:TolB-like protein